MANTPVRRMLVTGGCGCLGSHIVRLLLNDTTWDEIHVLDAKIDHGQEQDAIYHKGDLLSKDDINSVLAEVKPSAIIHSASPPAVGTIEAERYTFRVNVEGTKNLLDCAVDSKCVRAFVYTSSTSTMAGLSFHNAPEDGPLVTIDSSKNSTYAKSKSIADQTVREYNNPQMNFRTLSLRMCHLYGVGDRQIAPEILQKINAGQQKYQIGDNKAMYDVISATNAAKAHVLAVNKLMEVQTSATLEEEKRIDGEAFFITDGRPLHFWSWQLMVLSAAGDKTRPEDMLATPLWLALASAFILEWLYWIFTFGTAQPQVWRGWILRACCMPSTSSIEKARDRLGFSPQDDREEEIKKSVAWCYEHNLV